jgi:hypothetical protein
MSAAEILATGFRSSEIEKYIETAHDTVETAPDGSIFARSVTLSVNFDSVGERDTTRALLMELSNKQSVKPGTLIRQLLDGTMLDRK